jgi:hypothetical protein
MKRFLLFCVIIGLLYGDVFALSSSFKNVPSSNYDIICDWGNYYITITTSTPVSGYSENSSLFKHNAIPSLNNGEGYIFKIVSKELYAALLAAKMSGQTLKFLLVADGVNVQMSWDSQNVTWNAVQVALN